MIVLKKLKKYQSLNDQKGIFTWDMLAKIHPDNTVNDQKDIKASLWNHQDKYKENPMYSNYLKFFINYVEKNC